ncbi:MAG: alpha-galactosidase, partial [Planctomycetaceae bacterium]|nr:alpha-galactosidase [Planctomycetaceae bacterium]
FIDGYVKENIPIDYWWMDAGWYPCFDEWWKTGTWEPDPARFPKGLREVSDHAATYGIKTLVWFEPERVHSGSWLAENHPEWLLPGDPDSLFDLGNPEAWAWAVQHFDRLVKEQRIGYYRQDFNMPPLDYWRRNDAADRQGITEIRHVEGYLAYWDELRRLNPGLLIDTCASGGRRNDLETLRRAIPLHRSDYHRDPDANQAQTYGIAQWMPFFGIGGGGDDYILRSTVAPCNTFGVDMRIENQNLDSMREHLALRDRIKKFYLGDFYPLSAWSLDLSLWMAWQYDLPEAGQGMIQVFRRDQSEYEAAAYRLRGLNSELFYRIEDVDVGEIGVFKGQELMERGFRVTIPEKRTAKVFIYTACEHPHAG